MNNLLAVLVKFPVLLVFLCLTLNISIDAYQSEVELTRAGKNLENTYEKILNQDKKSLKIFIDRAVKSATHMTFLKSDKLDPKLARFVIINDATPRGLAEFSQNSPVNESLVKSLLKDQKLMIQMVVADGARRPRIGRKFGVAQYGPAIKIYRAIQKENPKAYEGLFQRLALAISLEHSVPIQQSNPKAAVKAPEFIDPLKRYRHYEKAYLEGELDPCFENLSVWELRMVVNGDEPDEILSWGRKTMRNYRPDHVTCGSEGWRYVRIVTSDINYGSGDVKYDLPELQKYQNILMNGGVCGRRAFFGRFILRAFGVPTIARPSRGHAALARFTPEGWTVCLGGDWGAGWTKTLYTSDKDFLASTQARRDRETFMLVKRAQWAGDVAGEKKVYGENDKNKPDFWNEIALEIQRSIIQSSDSRTLKALGEKLGEADGSSVEKGSKTKVTEADKKISYHSNGAISIPAAAYSAKNLKGISTMKSYDGGLQIFLPRFSMKGKTLLRGGSWKGDANACSSGWRLPSSGYGQYENWGFRVALTYNGIDAPKEMSLQLNDNVSMSFIFIKPGSFVMGGESKTDGKWHCVELPKHGVNITKGFYLGKYEVTQEQFQAVMGYNSSRSTIDPDCPVDNVSWMEALQFCENLSFKSSREIRLPTEAEWEYAARAGCSDKWFFGNTPAKMEMYAWGKSNSGGKSHKVGQKRPNPWGLYDIYGNVVERVADIYDKNYYKSSPKNDPKGPEQALNAQFEYEVNVRKGGDFFLTANVVTNKHSQIISLDLNKTTIDLNLPFTIGDWQESKAVKINLKKGKNTLRFYRNNPPQKGVAVKSFLLKPVR